MEEIAPLNVAQTVDLSRDDDMQTGVTKLELGNESEPMWTRSPPLNVAQTVVLSRDDDMQTGVTKPELGNENERGDSPLTMGDVRLCCERK